MNSTHIFQLRNVSFAHRKDSVLKDINLDLARGRFYGLIGGNGSGKSTLLELLTATLSPATGQITFLNRQLNKYSKQELSLKLSLVPQHFSMDFEYCVKDVVLMGRHPHIPRFASPSTLDIQSVERAMATMQILHLQNRPVIALSGGELQRVVIARALAQETEVLILDEATSNLDIQHTIVIMRVIRQRVIKNGLTVIAAIHDLNLAAAFCDDCLVLKEGKIVAHDTVNNVFSAELLQTVFNIESSVTQNDNTGSPQIQFRYR